MMPGLTLFDVRKEIEKRGLREPSGDNLESAPMIPDLRAIREEIARRGLQKQDPNKKPFSIGQRIGQFAHGAAHAGESLYDLARKGVGYLALSPEMVESPSAEGLITNPISKLAGRELMPGPEDTTGKVVHMAGQFALPLPGSGYAKGAQQGLKGLSKVAARETGLGAAVGAAGHGLEEMGLDPLSAGLGAGIGVPTALSLGRVAKAGLGTALRPTANVIPGLRSRVGEAEAARFLQQQAGQENIPQVLKNIEEYAPGIEGYAPPTADIAQNTGLSQYHRAISGTSPKLGEKQAENAKLLNEQVESLKPEGHDIASAVEHARGVKSNLTGKTLEARERFAAEGQPSELGSDIRQQLSEKTKTVRRKAREEAGPLFEKAHEETPGFTARNAADYIEEEYKTWAGSDIGEDLKKAWNLIHPAEEIKKVPKKGKRSAKSEKGIVSLSEMEHAFKGDYLDKALEKMHLTPSSQRLSTARKVIAARLQAIPKQERERRRVLGGVLENIDQDFEKYPAFKKARATYKEIMRPANVIEEHPVLGTFLEENPGFIQYERVDSNQIPTRVISGARAENASKALWEEVKDSPELKDKIKSYINSLFMNDVVDEVGKIDRSKLKAFKNKYPGTVNIYPELETFLKNDSNAQAFSNRLTRQNDNFVNKYNKEAADILLGSDSDKIMGRILSGKNAEGKMGEVLDLASTDKSGDSLQGLRASGAKHIKNSLTENMTHFRLNNYLKKNRAALSKLYTPEQMMVLDRVNDALKAKDIVGRQGTGYNSSTFEKMVNAAKSVAGKTLSNFLGIKWEGVFDLLSHLNEKNLILEKAMLDPKVAKKLLEMKVSDRASLMKTLQELKKLPKTIARTSVRAGAGAKEPSKEGE